MKNIPFLLTLLSLFLALSVVSCQNRGAVPLVMATEIFPSSTNTATPTRATAVGWTGNEVQPQEYVYPSETAQSSGVTAQPTATPRPSTTSRTPTRTPTATKTVRPMGPTLTPSRTPRYTATVTATATEPQQSGWTGTWVVYYGVDDNSLETGSMMVKFSGGNLSASAQFGSLEMIFTGGLAQQDLEASGTYTHPTDPGWFYWILVSANQFGGVLNDELVFCANRPGGQRPNPCGIHPSY